MKFLCLAYGAEKDWKALTTGEQNELLAQDEAIRQRGAMMPALRATPRSCRLHPAATVTIAPRASVA